MDASTFLAVVLACAPQVHANTAHALVKVESAFNPWAIGVVGGA
jgi:type IV secretion system protein VirB1